MSSLYDKKIKQWKLISCFSSKYYDMFLSDKFYSVGFDKFRSYYLAMYANLLEMELFTSQFCLDSRFHCDKTAKCARDDNRIRYTAAEQTYFFDKLCANYSCTKPKPDLDFVLDLIYEREVVRSLDSIDGSEADKLKFEILRDNRTLEYDYFGIDCSGYMVGQSTNILNISDEEVASLIGISLEEYIAAKKSFFTSLKEDIENDKDKGNIILYQARISALDRLISGSPKKAGGQCLNKINVFKRVAGA